MKSERPPRPEGEILSVLKGSISEPVEARSAKPGHEDETVNVRLVQKGSGMVGLETASDNKEWAGIFNHVIRTTRLATFIAKALHEKGIEVNPDEVLNTVLVSHSGRRQFDEAQWYPDAVSDRESKQDKSDTDLSVNLLEKAGISPIIVDNVRAHNPNYPLDRVNANWAAKIALYSDWRTSQRIVPLQQRFEEFRERAIPAGRVTEEEFQQLRDFYTGVEREIFSLLQDIKPEDFDDNFPPPPKWEAYVRRLYVQDAERGIFAQYARLQTELEHAKNGAIADVQAKILTAFPENSWWGQYVRDLYEKQKGVAKTSAREDKQVGIARAIEFFSRLDGKRN